MMTSALGLTLLMTLASAGAGVGPDFKTPAAAGRVDGAVPGARCETDTGHVLGHATADGARFVATTGGLVVERDGQPTAVWTACDGLPATYVQAVATLPDGDLAVAYRGHGVWRLDPRTGAQERLAAHPELRWVTALAWHRDELWIGTLQRGLWRATSDGPQHAFRSRFRKGRVSALVSRPDGSLLIGRDLGGLWRLSTMGRIRRLLRGSVQGITVAGPDVHIDQGHATCVLAARARACRPLDEAATMPPPAARPLHITTLTVHRDHEGVERLWAGTFDRGLLVQTDVGWRPPTGSGAPPRMINQLTSTDGALWAATPTGAFQLKDGVWRRFGEHSGLPTHHVNAIHVDDNGAVWFATSKGLATWREGGGLHRLGEERGLPYRIIYSLTRAAGHITVGTSYGLGVLRHGRFDTYRVGAGGLADNWINAVAEEPGGSLLIGTYDRGVDRLVDGRVERVAGLERAWVNPGGLLPSGSGTFVATLGDGLFHLDLDGSVTHWPGAGALPSTDVTAVQRFGDRLWIGTREGIASWPLHALPAGAPEA